MLQGKVRGREVAARMPPKGPVARGVRVPTRSKVVVAGAAGIAALAALWPLGAVGAPSTLVECIEGADFVANAAASRDNGLARGSFLDRLEADFLAIRAFPVALRWFVKDADDEDFLREAVESVYDRPLDPERHRAAFFAACVTRAAA